MSAAAPCLTTGSVRPMLDLLNGFVVELRNAGLPVSLTENLDAMEAVQHIPIEDREAFKYALGATLIKNNCALAGVRDGVRGLLQPARPASTSSSRATTTRSTRCGARCRSSRQGEGRGGGGGAMDSLTPEEIAQLLMQALLNGDQAMMRALARQAVQRFAGMEPGRPVGGTYYLYRTLRNLDLDGMLEKLMEASRRAGRRRADRARGAARAGRVRAAASRSSRRRSRPRSAAAWSPTAAPRRWPRRCASRCPRTSSSCTPRATRCSRCARRCTR